MQVLRRMGQAAYHMVLEDPELELAGLLIPMRLKRAMGIPSAFMTKKGFCRWMRM